MFSYVCVAFVAVEEEIETRWITAKQMNVLLSAFLRSSFLVMEHGYIYVRGEMGDGKVQVHFK
jgi:hypothetical protein